DGERAVRFQERPQSAQRAEAAGRAGRVGGGVAHGYSQDVRRNAHGGTQPLKWGARPPIQSANNIHVGARLRAMLSSREQGIGNRKSKSIARQRAPVGGARSVE